MITNPGRRPSLSEIPSFLSFIPEYGSSRKVIIHHVTEDTWNKVQIEYEVWHWGTLDIKFKRLIVSL